MEGLLADLFENIIYVYIWGTLLKKYFIMNASLSQTFISIVAYESY